MSACTAFIRQDRFQRLLVTGLISVGVILRLIYFLQNRNLIIDEANIALNLSERNFIQLLTPLHYQQYAPPVFLWIEKGCTLLFGYGEKALRLYPLLCGVLSLFVFYKILSRWITRQRLWYSLALFATGNIYVRYSAVAKQYMPDLLICLILVWLCLTLDFRKTSKIRFILIWSIAGSLAVWSSMPAVFVLAGVAGYYGWMMYEEKLWKSGWKLFLPVIVWCLQFLVYFEFILKSQIGSTYLQQYHSDYFLIGLPSTTDEWLHNAHRILAILGEMGGFTALSLVFHGGLIIAGTIWLYRNNKKVVFLLGLPILLLLTAAALHQYSLIERLILFVLPLGLCLVAFGIDWLMLLKRKWVNVTIVSIGLICIYNYALLGIVCRYYGFQEITRGMSFLVEQKADSHHIYIHHGSTGSFKYYTTLHPKKNQWENIADARIMPWDFDYAQETRSLTDTVYFLFTGGLSNEERLTSTRQIEEHMEKVIYYEEDQCYVEGFRPKQ